MGSAVTYQNVYTVRAEEAHDERHDGAKDKTSIVKGHGHSQNSRAQ